MSIYFNEKMETNAGENRERFFSALIELSRELITVINHAGVIVFKNQAADMALGYGPAELIGRDIHDLIHPDDLVRVRTALDEAVYGTQAAPVEHRFLHKDGSWRMFESSCRHARDLPFGSLNAVYSRDITDRKSLEAQLWQAQRMDVASRMTSAIAHGFGNFLTSIITSADLLLEGEPAAHVRRNATQVKETAQRAELLTRQLLMFVRHGSSGTPAPVNVNEMIVELASLLADLVGQDVTLAFDFNAVATSVMLDRSLLGQAIVNLVVNARDAMPAGGVITLTTSNVWQSVDNAVAQCVVIEVRDEGGGMTEDVKARVFEPFFTTKDPGHGHGLGSSIAFSIVHQAGGRIEVDSELGRGTRVRVILPRHH